MMWLDNPLYCTQNSGIKISLLTRRLHLLQLDKLRIWSQREQLPASGESVVFTRERLPDSLKVKEAAPAETTWMSKNTAWSKPGPEELELHDFTLGGTGKGPTQRE